MLMYPCLQAAKAAAEDAAKTADEVDAATHEVKQEKVKKTAQHTKTAHSFSILLLTARCVACVRAGPADGDHGEHGRQGEHAEHENLR